MPRDRFRRDFAGNEELEALERLANQNFDADISSFLEQWLIDIGLEQLNEYESLESSEFPNFPKIAHIVGESGKIYGRKIDALHLWVINTIYNSNESSNVEAKKEALKVIKKQKKKAEGLIDFTQILLEEATDINMRNSPNSRDVSLLPKAFIQFDTRVISDNDVQLKDVIGEPFGLVTDFRVNWNTDSNFTLNEEMDFRAARKVTNKMPHPSIVCSPDSGHTSDFYGDFTPTVCDDTEVEQTEVEQTEVKQTEVRQTEVEPTEIEQPRVPQEIHGCQLSKDQATPAKRRKIETPNLTKFDIFNPIKMTFNNPPSYFSLPETLIKAVERRKLYFKSLSTNAYTENEWKKKFEFKKFCPDFKSLKRTHSMSWSRCEIYKKLMLDKWMDTDTKGFEATENSLKDIEHLKNRCYEIETCSSNKECENDLIYEDDGFQEVFETMQESCISKKLAAKEDIPCNEFDSEQSKKFEEWNNALQVKLKSIENHNSFDIKVYTSNVIKLFDSRNKSSQIPFSNIVKNKPPEDISRYFLTTLMLANIGKVKIEQPPPLSCQDFKITLTSQLTDEELERIGSDL